VTAQPGFRPNPWIGAIILKLTPIRTGTPIAFFDARFPLFEATMHGCTLWRTKAGKLWAVPPKQKRVLPDGTPQWDDVVEWDSGRPASMFSEACLEAIERHTPELLTPLIEGRDEAGVPLPVAPGWERGR
jgi:hypothetical protein